MLEESKIDVPPITEFQTGYEKGIKPSVVMVTGILLINYVNTMGVLKKFDNS